MYLRYLIFKKLNNMKKSLIIIAVAIVSFIDVNAQVEYKVITSLESMKRHPYYCDVCGCSTFYTSKYRHKKSKKHIKKM